MDKLKYLNLGCGNKYHPNWINIDMVSNSKDVLVVNLLNGIPYPDQYFDVVYHSQVLEHIPKEKANVFLKECYRVLKPNGIIRVVLPNLEDITSEYLRLLKENLDNPNVISEANYDWIMLEMYDQTVRNYKGGQMAEYIRQPVVPNIEYVFDRIGFIGKTIREGYLKTSNSFNSGQSRLNWNKKVFKFYFRRAIKLLQFIIKIVFPRSQAKSIGDFRMSGEIHMWMYDRFSLSRLLLSCGFINPTVKNPFESEIPDWGKYELDVKDNIIYDPKSLFMEARKM